jgi:hypothetical protein
MTATTDPTNVSRTSIIRAVQHLAIARENGHGRNPKEMAMGKVIGFVNLWNAKNEPKLDLDAILENCSLPEGF